jgi:hypothetical protein
MTMISDSRLESEGTAYIVSFFYLFLNILNSLFSKISYIAIQKALHRQIGIGR